jgi:hypothetical protein
LQGTGDKTTLWAWLVYNRQVWSRRLQSGWERAWFYAFQTQVALVNFSLGVAANVGDLLDPFSGLFPQTPFWIGLGWAFRGLGFALAAVGLIGLGANVWRMFRPNGDYELRDAEPELGHGLKGLTQTKDKILAIRGHNGVVVVNASVDAQLDRGSHRIKLRKDSYAWPEELKLAAKLARREMNRLALNEHKLGLRSEIDSEFVAADRSVEFQKTRYFFDRTTNSVLNRDVWSRLREQRVARGRDYFISEDNRLIRLEQAGASNQLGGSTLMVDQSRQVHLTMQTSTSAESPDLLAPSGSGSFDLFRYQTLVARQPNLTFQEFCRSEIERELFEETALVANTLELKTFLIGFGRFLYRGGKPEIFAVSALRRSTATARVTTQERLWTGGHEVVPLDDLLSWKPDKLATVSAPLAANIELLRRYLDSPAGAAFQDFLGGRDAVAPTESNGSTAAKCNVAAEPCPSGSI